MPTSSSSAPSQLPVVPLDPVDLLTADEFRQAAASLGSWPVIAITITADKAGRVHGSIDVSGQTATLVGGSAAELRAAAIEHVGVLAARMRRELMLATATSAEGTFDLLIDQAGALVGTQEAGETGRSGLVSRAKGLFARRQTRDQEPQPALDTISPTGVAEVSAGPEATAVGDGGQPWEGASPDALSPTVEGDVSSPPTAPIAPVVNGDDWAHDDATQDESVADVDLEASAAVEPIEDPAPVDLEASAAVEPIEDPAPVDLEASAAVEPIEDPAPVVDHVVVDDSVAGVGCARWAREIPAGAAVEFDGEVGEVVHPESFALPPDMLTSALFPEGFVVVALEDGTAYAQLERVRVLPLGNDDPVAADPSADRSWRGMRTRLVAIVAVITLVVVAGIAAVAGVLWSAARAESDLDAARAGYESVVSELVAASATAAEVLSSSDGKVAASDDGLREVLAGLIERAEAASVPLAVDGLDRAVATDEYHSSMLAVEALTVELTGATSAVSAAMSRWELHEAVVLVDDSAADLDAAIDAAKATLAESEGKVDDDGVRQGLSVTIAAAEDVRARSAGSSVDELTSRAAELSDEASVVRAARQLVIDAQGVWQTGQDAAAQEAADAAAREAAEAGGKSGGGTTATSPPQQSPGGTGTPAPAPAPAPPAEGLTVKIGTVSVTGGVGTVSLSVPVSTSRPTSVSVTCSVGGRGVSMSGSSGSISGLPAGVHTWSCSASAEGITATASGSIETF